MSGDYSREQFNGQRLQRVASAAGEGPARRQCQRAVSDPGAALARADHRHHRPLHGAAETAQGFTIAISGTTLTIGRGRILRRWPARREPWHPATNIRPGARGTVWRSDRVHRAADLPDAAHAAPPPAPGRTAPRLRCRPRARADVPRASRPRRSGHRSGHRRRAADGVAVRVLRDVGAGVTCITPDPQIPAWMALRRPSEGRLTTSVVEIAADPNPCAVGGAGGYRGLENQLYRVDIHERRAGRRGKLQVVP